MKPIRVAIEVLPKPGVAPVPLPQQMSAFAAGFDVVAAIGEPLTLGSGDRALVPCGFSMAIPEGYECQVRPRSGLAYKHGVTVLNAPGTIDADYRGEVRVLLINTGTASYLLQPAERIAQLVFAPVVRVLWDSVTCLEHTVRGDGGFGSTGS